LQNAFHLYKIDSTITTLGTTITNYITCISELRNLLKEESIKFHISPLLDTLPLIDIRRIFIELLEDPYRLLHVAKDVAQFEILWNISKDTQFKKVTLFDSTTPYFKGEDIADINLSLEDRVGSSISVQNSETHYLLSGPNGGGKSSFLRGVLQTVLFAQTYGYSSASNVELAPFDYIMSGLHIQDLPGKKSLFEKEICFARDVLYYNNPAYKGVILFDEIFHSTNPPDCIKTSNVFLNKLWSYTHVASIVSTHVFEIIDVSPRHVKKICVDAHREADTLVYSYKIKPGVSKESSVTEIWKKVWSE
jgi:DNA mismatch repair ATPase MutS